MPPVPAPKQRAVPKPRIKVAVCMPKQEYNRQDKLLWLHRALEKTECDLFLTPQEYFGGHYVMKNDLHVEREWLLDCGALLAKKHGKHLGIGACVKATGAGAMEDYLYFDDAGQCLGQHSKFALPSYDDQRTGGHGQLWPETNYKRRITPVAIPKLRLRIGTVFCWEAFSQTIIPAYSLANVNMIVHPIKFAPRGWLKNKVLEDGKKHIVGFGNAPKSQIWIDRLIMASRHQCFCPIAVSCNSWNLGEKYMALVGHVDEMKKCTTLHDVPSLGSEEKIHVFEMLPEFYEGLDHHHSAGAFVAHVGEIDGYQEMGEHTMHGKMRRLESHLINGTSQMECMMKAAAGIRQKKSIIKRAFGTAMQPVKLPKK